VRSLNPDRFAEHLAAAQVGKTFNQYAASELRRRRLALYLEARADARYLLVGEAAGYRGARISGLPFTSERQLSGTGPAEASATVVHRVLAELGLEGDVLLWNVVPTHPHRRGCSASNRPPTKSEVREAVGFLEQLAPDRLPIAVGRLAHSILGGRYVRHPAHGGSAAFRTGLLLSIAGGEKRSDRGRGDRSRRSPVPRPPSERWIGRGERDDDDVDDHGSASATPAAASADERPDRRSRR